MLLAAGDTGFNRSHVNVYPDGMLLWGRKVPFSQMLRRVRSLINGDVNFCNLETVVTNRNDLRPLRGDKYGFRTHPNAVKLLVSMGFNLFSIANNHADDYGRAGVMETRRWLYRIRRRHRIAFAGAGINLKEASRVMILKVNGVRIAFGALGFGKEAGPHSWGVASVFKPIPVLKALKKARADIRILSMHAGLERHLRPVDVQRKVAHLAIDRYRVDIVIGHHPHVVQGIERYHGGIIFYSLGNFALRGAMDMSKVKSLRYKGDYGLIVRLTMTWDTRTRRLIFKRLQAIPITDMHCCPHPYERVSAAKRRIDFLNRLSRELAPSSRNAVQFRMIRRRFIYIFR